MIDGRLPLTAIEDQALSTDFNLADGHAQHLLPPKLVNELPSIRDLLSSGLISDYKQLEASVVNALFEINGQSGDPDKSFCFYSASQAIEIASLVVRAFGRDTFLIEPTFDNLADLFSRTFFETGELARVVARNAESFVYPHSKMWPIAASELSDLRFIKSLPQDIALFLVLPNNPTGDELSEEQFQRLCSSCRDRNILLIIDFCFRPYSKTMLKWDQYAIAYQSGVTFMFIEDTGKTFPLKDAKVGILSVSADLEAVCRRFRYDSILTISPIILCTLLSALEHARINSFDFYMKQIEENREYLYAVLDDLNLTVVNAAHFLPFEWLRQNNSLEKDFVTYAKRRGVQVLPGDAFFWSRKTDERFVRISLSRPCEYFKSAVQRLREDTTDA
jgi:aspartate/methionine/tyrosine aminotransferase